MRNPRGSEIIYQIYPSSFADSDGDGLGDLRGITGKLDYIKSLNVDAIWISPFYKSPEGMAGDGGYAVSDYRSVDPKFGTMDDFKTLLRTAHAKGLRVYTDFVLAHTAADHDWFEKSRDRVPGFENHYVWRDQPNNWKSAMGGAAWSFDPVRGQYYLHNFLESQPSLNLNDGHVQDAVLNEMKYWLDMGVDGFRLDALPFCNYDPDFRDNPLMAARDPKHKDSYREQHLIHSMNLDLTRDFMTRVKGLMDGYAGNRAMLGEVLAGQDGGRNSIPVAASFVNAPEGVDMCYTGELLNIQHYPDAACIKEILFNIEHYFPQGGHCNALSNHDKARSATRLTRELAPEHKTAAAQQMLKLLFSLRGNICLYQGEELGLPQASIPQDIRPDQIRDPIAQLKNPAKGPRDGSRTPMVWDEHAIGGGFSTANETWLPIMGAHYPLAVNSQNHDSHSTLNMLRHLTAWRKNQPALNDGATIFLDAPAPVFAFLRKSADQTVLCAFNFSDRAQTIDLRMLLDEKTRRAVGNHESLTLQPFGAEFRGDIPLPAPALKQDRPAYVPGLVPA